MNYYAKNIEESLSSLESSLNGLTANQIEKCSKTYGKNCFTQVAKKTLWQRFKVVLGEPMIKLLIGTIILTIIINLVKTFQDAPTNWEESLGITLAVILSCIITIVMEARSQKAFESLQEVGSRHMVLVIRDGKTLQIDKEDLYPGDIVIINTGDKIPADGRIIQCNLLEMEEAMLTGESEAVFKDPAALCADSNLSLGQQKNMVFSGTYAVAGNGKFVVTSTGDNSEIGKIAQSIQHDYNETTPLQKQLARFGKKLAIIGISIATVVFIIKILHLYLNQNLSLDNFASTVALCIILVVATIPEGLSAMVATTLALAMVRLSKDKALIKKLICCEAIGSVDTICSDKTGTITENKMLVKHGDFISEEFVRLNIAYNNNAIVNKDENGNHTFSGNATEVALLKYFDNITSNCDAEILQQVPFNSAIKVMETVIRHNNKIYYLVKGAPEKIIAKSNLSQDIPEKIISFQDKAMRIIAFAHKELSIEELNLKDFKTLSNLEFDGFAAIADPVRGDVKKAVDECRNANIAIKILTGDNIHTARAIAKELNLINHDSLVVEAAEIDAIEDSQLLEIIEKIVVIARSNPATKLRVVDLLMKNGHSVAVTGDGINDAPALKRAEVGIAMGITGTEVSKETADIVLLDDSFSTIVKAIEGGRGLYENIQKFIQFQQTVNVAALFLVLIFEVLKLPTPLTPLQLLWINIIMDGPLAVSLSFEKNRSDIMNEKPRQKNAHIINLNAWSYIASNALYMLASITCLVYFLEIDSDYVSTYSFCLIIFMVIFNLFNCKESTSKSVLKRLFDNKVLNIVVVITFALQFLIVTYFSKAFSIKVLSLVEYMAIFGFSISIIFFGEFNRLIRRIILKK